jgi:hypothetical protein
MGKNIEMLNPVVCLHCGAVYDLCATEPVARLTDCDVFKTPCCNRTADTRRWKGLPDYRDLRQDDFMPMDIMGNIRHIRIIDPEETRAAIRAKEVV